LPNSFQPHGVILSGSIFGLISHNRTRFKEHIRDIRFNQIKSKYVQHILDFNHEYGTIENTMEIIRTAQKGKYLDVLERFHVYKASKSKPILNKQYGTDSNILFEDTY
jgi:hypothetical protein